MYDIKYCYWPLTDKVFHRFWRRSEGVREVKTDVWLWNGVKEQAARFFLVSQLLGWILFQYNNPP